jgi:hypothetical protein
LHFLEATAGDLRGRTADLGLADLLCRGVEQLSPIFCAWRFFLALTHRFAGVHGCRQLSILLDFRR